MWGHRVMEEAANRMMVVNMVLYMVGLWVVVVCQIHLVIQLYSIILVEHSFTPLIFYLYVCL